MSNQPTEWFKSTFSGVANCVEVSINLGAHPYVVLRDTHYAEVCYDAAEWIAFIEGAKAGEFDLPVGAPRQPRWSDFEGPQVCAVCGSLWAGHWLKRDQRPAEYVAEHVFELSNSAEETK